MNRFAVAALAALSFASSAHAATNLVVNGDFEQTTSGIGQMGYNTDATGWTTSGYNFIMNGNADTSGVQGFYGFLGLWGPGNGSSNGFTTSPTGGNFVGADGAFWVGGISQLITGLVPGQKYVVSFDWAAAQQYGYNGANTEQWEIDLGSQAQYTSVYSNADHGFSGWMHDSLTFTATSSTDFLTFVAHGTPAGVPPFSLLDGVSMYAAAAPEPATWAMMVLGFGVLGAAMRRRQKQTPAVSYA